MKGTKTENALRTIVSGECQTMARYLLAAKAARNEGFEKLGEIFEKTAFNELAHAEIFLRKLNCLGNAGDQVEDAVKTERHEWSELYPAFAAQAREEGFPDLADRMDKIAEVEKWHESQFQKWLDQIRSASVYKGENNSVWLCENCGYHAAGETPPTVCPVCGRPIGFFSMTSTS